MANLNLSVIDECLNLKIFEFHRIVYYSIVIISVEFLIVYVLSSLLLNLQYAVNLMLHKRTFFAFQ